MLIGQRQLGLRQGLEQYIRKHRSDSYILGVNDCFIFSLRWALGVIPDLAYWRNSKDVQQAIKAHRGTKSHHIMDYYLERTESPIEGDIIQTSDEGWGCFGILHDGCVITIDHSGMICRESGYIRAWGCKVWGR